MTVTSILTSISSRQILSAPQQDGRRSQPKGVYASLISGGGGSGAGDCDHRKIAPVDGVDGPGGLQTGTRSGSAGQTCRPRPLPDRVNRRQSPGRYRSAGKET